MPTPQSPAKTPGSPPSRPGISPARSAAFRILLDLVRSASAHSDDLLRSAPVNALSPQDRNLCTALTMGVLRWQLLLDEEIARLLKHQARLDDPVRVAVRLGAFQLLFLDRIPAHAAISDSVELTKRAGHRFASGMVNAVLRRLAGAPAGLFEARRAHPAWLLERWAAFLSAEHVDAVCAYDQQPPPAAIRLAGPGAEAALAAEGIQLAPGHFLISARRVLSGDIASSSVVRAGHARMQDEGSQLVAELLCGNPGLPSRVLDCCAAPGGKTAILAERHPGSIIIACDVSAARVARMQALFEMQPALAQIQSRVADAIELSPADAFDRILCDVPCSGTGTLARNPEIKVRLQAGDLARQHTRQAAILRSALHALSPAGELVYSTCSLEPEENEQVVQAILAGEQGFRIVPVRDRILELSAAGVLHAEGAELLLAHGVHGSFLRTIPGVIPVDGFFAAIFTRK